MATPANRRPPERLSEQLFRVNLHYGFMEQPHVPRALKSCSREFDLADDTTYFLSHEVILNQPTPRMAAWRLPLFIGMTRNTGSAIGYFRIPTERVIELGTQMRL